MKKNLRVYSKGVILRTTTTLNSGVQKSLRPSILSFDPKGFLFVYSIFQKTRLTEQSCIFSKEISLRTQQITKSF